MGTRRTSSSSWTSSAQLRRPRATLISTVSLLRSSGRGIPIGMSAIVMQNAWSAGFGAVARS